MILKEYNLSVRLPQEKAIDTGITLVQNDKDVYKLNVRIFDGVNEIDYSEVDSATITFLKRDNNVVQGNMAVEADHLSYTLGTNEIAAPGKLIATIQLLGANERLTTARFLFRVEKDLITEDAVKSTSEFAILQQLKNELEEIDVVELTNQFNAHKAENVIQGNNPHGFIYEEGTWTPSIRSSANVPYTLSEASGRYVRVGNIVHVWFRVKSIDDVGDPYYVLLYGLPYAPSVNIEHAGTASSRQDETFISSTHRIRVTPTYVFICNAKLDGSTVNFSFSDEVQGYFSYIV